MRIVPLKPQRRIFLAVVLAIAAVAAIQIWVGVFGDRGSSEQSTHPALASFQFSIDPETGTVDVFDVFGSDSGADGVVRAADVNGQFAVTSMSQSFSPPTFTLNATFQKTSGPENTDVFSRTSALAYSDGVPPHPTLLADRCSSGVGSEKVVPGVFNVSDSFDISYVITLPNPPRKFDFYVDIHDGESLCLNALPTAEDDSFDALGNTELAVGLPILTPPTTTLTGSILDNDSDPDGDTLAVIPFAGPTGAGGSVDIDSDGHFRYRPPVAYNGPDTFPYTVDDGNTGQDIGQVTINVTDMVWYVDSGATPGGDGRSHAPFTSLHLLSTGGSAADGPGDIIFVHQGSGDTPGGIVLENNQQLIGQGVNLSVGGFSPDPLVSLTGPPTIAAAGGNGVTLAQHNTVRGLSVTNSSGGGIVGVGGVGTLAINTVDSILTNNGSGIEIEGGGVVEISGGTTTITTTNGTGLEISGTTIGASGVTFESISASGGANGIVLWNTGSAGGLSVTGTGTTDGSGGVLSATTGDGIWLGTTKDVSLKNMNISGTGASGIKGSVVTDLTIDGLALSNIGNADEEHGITMDNLAGSASILNTTIDNAADHNVRVVNSSGTLDLLRVEDGVFTGGGASTHGGSGVYVKLTGSAVAASVQIGDTSSPADDPTDDTQFMNMDGYGVALLAGLASGSGGTFTSVSIDDIAVNSANAGGVLLAMDGEATGTFSLTNSDIEADNATAVAVGADGDSTATATITNNTTTVINTSFFGVSNIGIRADGNAFDDTPTLVVLIDGNTISGGDAYGINASSRGSAGSLDAIITNNTVSNVGYDGMFIGSGNGTSDETDTVRVFMSGNNSVGGFFSYGYHLQDQSGSTTFEIGCDDGTYGACTPLIGTTTGTDQGVLAMHNNIGTPLFLGSFKIIDSDDVNAP